MTATKFLASLLATFVTLLVLWCAAGTAHAATFQEGDCRDVPLLQSARPGETVRVCELTRYPSVVEPTVHVIVPTHVYARTASKARHAAHRTGHTTVVHYGARAATYTIAYVR